MSTPIALVAWEDATKKPPERRPIVGRPIVETDVGLGVYEGHGTWIRPNTNSGNWHARQEIHPTWWRDDPSPPGPDALTVEGLTFLLEQVEYAAESLDGFYGSTRTRITEETDRLRAALDALGTGGTE